MRLTKYLLAFTLILMFSLLTGCTSNEKEETASKQHTDEK